MLTTHLTVFFSVCQNLIWTDVISELGTVLNMEWIQMFSVLGFMRK